MSKLFFEDGTSPRPIDITMTLIEEIDQIKVFIEKAKPTATPGLMAEYYKRLRHLDDRLKQCIKDLKSIMDPLQTEVLPDLFEKNKVKSLTTEDGYRITISQRVHASIKSEQKEAAFDWLRQNSLGNLIYETVNAQSLAAAAKDRMSNNREMPDDIFNVFVAPSISLTKT